ncbi:MAG TPA: HAD family hydrolase [Solirubrobacteraceae bacterium]|jgi:putative hydrolase of the HAD superfamily|nr:HAD family hydrolase [Solirubrobacteraceae bacterium]
MLRAVLFDLDGTLMDHDAARTAGLRAHLSSWLPGLGADELARLEKEWQRLEALHYDEYARRECTFAEQRRRRVQGMHTVMEREPADELAADAWFGSYLRHYRAAWRAFDDVHLALAALAVAHPSVALGVVTNGEGEPQRAKLAAIGLGERFRVVVASGEEGVAKPEAEIFALACERLGAEQEQTVHVGDRLDLDAEAAAAAGLRGIWLDRLGTVSSPAHIMRISTLHELPAVLCGLGQQ